MLAKQPKFIQAYMALGTIYEAQGKKVEARQMYEKALEVNPNFAPAANNLAWTLLQSNEDPDRALELAKIAKEQLPDDPNVADTLGLAFIAKGLYQSAVSELSMAVEKLPEHPTVRYHLGLALWKSGEKEQAVEALEKALGTKLEFPEREQAKQLLEEIRTERT
jgi:Flp pilus assembly protein TadD